ncbi:hypothetical protein CC79DRAFT_1391718 [Sarocladium strictum]
MELYHAARVADKDGPPPSILVPPTDDSAYYPVSERAAHLAVMHLAGTTPLLIIGLIMYMARIWIRVRPVWRISWEDYVMSIGLAAAIVDVSFMYPQMYTSPRLLTEEERVHARKYAFLTIPIWGVAISMIKSSIALTLLRIQPNVFWWRIFLWTIITIMSIYGFGNVFFILLQCRPLQASWNPSILEKVDGKCLPVLGIHIMSNLGSAINIGTDVLLSLAPIMFLWKLKRPLREKILVGCLMAMGLFASIASIFKTITVSKYGDPTIDTWALNNSLATWTALEQLVAMIAASAPFLKPLLHPVLQRLGLSLTGTKKSLSYRYGNSGYRRTDEQISTLSRSKTANEEEGRIRKTTMIRTTVRGFDEGNESSLAGSEDGIPLEPRNAKLENTPGEPNSWLDTHSDKGGWSLQKHHVPAQAV